jgi:hypothetical protein
VTHDAAPWGRGHARPKDRTPNVSIMRTCEAVFNFAYIIANGHLRA